MLKKTTIKNLDGLIISDPSYSNDVWCRYYTDKKFKNVVITLETTLEEDIFGRSISFKLLIAEKELSDLIGLGEKANPMLPVNYKKGKREIGMDTASIYIGNKKNFISFGEDIAISTGTDGLFGDVISFTKMNETEPSGVLLLGLIDESFISEEELFNHIVACLGDADGNL